MITLDINGNSLLKLTIDKGTLDGLVENKGLIQADGGEVYLTTQALDEVLNGMVNNSGIIEANSVEQKDGKIILFAHGGTGQYDGTLSAKGGFVETSAKELSVAETTQIVANKWLLDPTNLIVESTGGSDLTGASVSATAIQNALSANIELQADEDITINENITWADATTLTLTAGDEIYLNAIIENTNDTQGGVLFNAANNTDKVIFDPATGKVIINNIHQLQNVDTALNGIYELGSNIDASDTVNWNGGAGFDPIGFYNSWNDYAPFTGQFDGKGFVIDGLIINRPSENGLGLFASLESQNTIQNLGLHNITITGDGEVGSLAGQSKSISLKNVFATNIDITSTYSVGGLIGGYYDTTSAVSFDNVYTTGSINADNYGVGGFIGQAYPDHDFTIKNSYAQVDIIGTSDADAVGGLIGEAYISKDYGFIVENSYASANIKGGWATGGLIGSAQGLKLTNSYATGTVTALGGASDNAGGLIGYVYYGNDSSIENSYADVEISSGSAKVGGFIGYIEGTNPAATITNSYWNTTKSGLTGDESVSNLTQAESGVVGKTTEELFNPATFSAWDSNIWGFQQVGRGETIEGYEYSIAAKPYLKNITRDEDIVTGVSNTLFQSGWGDKDGAGAYTITNWDQLQNINLIADQSFDYELSNNLDATTAGYTTQVKDGDTLVNGGKGWNPIGVFNGNFDGKGFVVDGLTIDHTYSNRGLFREIGTQGVVQNLGVTNANIKGHWDSGIFAGENYGTIANSYTTGSISSRGSLTSGFVAINEGTISNSYSSANVYNDGDTSRLRAAASGFVGLNDGGTITKSYSTGKVESVYGAATGFVGDNSGGTISSSYSSGDVKGKFHIAGFVLTNDGLITNSYSSGELTNETEYFMGGFVLINYQDGGVIKNSYTSAKLNPTLPINAGGFAFSPTGTLENVFFDQTINPEYKGFSQSFIDAKDVDPSVYEPTAKTTEELQTLSTFSDAGWDIKTTSNSSYAQNSYPFLDMSDGSWLFYVKPEPKPIVESDLSSVTTQTQIVTSEPTLPKPTGQTANTDTQKKIASIVNETNIIQAINQKEQLESFVPNINNTNLAIASNNNFVQVINEGVRLPSGFETQGGDGDNEQE
jgi:hypothetical protein